VCSFYYYYDCSILFTSNWNFLHALYYYCYYIFFIKRFPFFRKHISCHLHETNAYIDMSQTYWNVLIRIYNYKHISPVGCDAIRMTWIHDVNAISVSEHLVYDSVSKYIIILEALLSPNYNTLYLIVSYYTDFLHSRFHCNNSIKQLECKSIYYQQLCQTSQIY